MDETIDPVATPTPVGNRLLILEHDASFAAQVAKVAQGVGVEASVAGNLREFERQYVELQPGMLTLDVVLGKEDVFAVIEFLGQRRATEPIFLVSGYDHRLVDAVASAAMDFGLLVADRIPKSGDCLRRLTRQLKAYRLEV